MTNQAVPSSAPADAAHSPEPRKNILAVVSVWVSVVGLVTFFAGVASGLIGAILGHIALRQMKRDPGRYYNRGAALGGVIVGWISFVLVAAAQIFMVVEPSRAASIIKSVTGG